MTGAIRSSTSPRSRPSCSVSHGARPTRARRSRCCLRRTNVRLTPRPPRALRGCLACSARALAVACPTATSEGAGPAPASVSGVSSDQAERVQQVLGALGVSGIPNVQVVNTSNAVPDHADPISQLEKLAALRESGALTDAEFEQQKRRILGEP